MLNPSGILPVSRTSEPRMATENSEEKKVVQSDPGNDGLPPVPVDGSGVPSQAFCDSFNALI
jgi:hypothetical protein